MIELFKMGDPPFMGVLSLLLIGGDRDDGSLPDQSGQDHRPIESCQIGLTLCYDHRNSWPADRVIPGI